MMAKLPKRPDTIQFGIGQRADQVLMLAEQSIEPKRTELHRVALELERLRCNLFDILEDGTERIGHTWSRLTRSAAYPGEGRMAKYRALRAELDPDLRPPEQRELDELIDHLTGGEGLDPVDCRPTPSPRRGGSLRVIPGGLS
jgi:hypothetical protein